MKNKKFTCISFLLLLLLAGCNSVTEQDAKNTLKESPLQKKILQADACLKQKRFPQALILYLEAQKQTDEIKLFRLLQLKISTVHCEMKNYPAALAALAPMPELPATLHDCQKLVMAARILQKMKGKNEHIESLLEVALDNSIEGEGVIPFKACAYAELGRVYVAGRKTARAFQCFKYAAKLYTAAGDKENALLCRNIMEYLR